MNMIPIKYLGGFQLAGLAWTNPEDEALMPTPWKNGYRLERKNVPSEKTGKGRSLGRLADIPGVFSIAAASSRDSGITEWFFIVFLRALTASWIVWYDLGVQRRTSCQLQMFLQFQLGRFR